MTESEFQSLEVIGIKELANAPVRFLSNFFFFFYDIDYAKGVLSVRKPRVSSKDGFRRDN